MKKSRFSDSEIMHFLKEAEKGIPVAQICHTYGISNATLGMEVDISLPSERVIRTLDRIIEWRGKPNQIRCDNGPECKN